MSDQVTTLPQLDLAKKLNNSVFSVIASDQLIGFEKAYLIANAAGELKKLLSPEYMKPIMELQNNRLGFKTDKPAGYDEATVKNCLIEAVLTGVQPFGNQFNIIAGNCYITKEGFGYLLAKFPGLTYEIIPALPRINADKTSAAILMKVEWTLNGQSKTRELDIPTKMNQYMGTDAVIGKATRKARAWLFSTITGTEIGDGDASEMDAKNTTIIIKETHTVEELQLLLDEKVAIIGTEDFKNAKRIIANKEETSYNKLYLTLTNLTEQNG
jgi:hypothetical protein